MNGESLPPRGSIKAVVFDIYGTLLQVLPGAAEPEKAWAELGMKWFGHPPSLSWARLKEVAADQVSRAHARLRAAGVDYPEVEWPRILKGCLPELENAGVDELEEFSAAWAGIRHSTVAMPGAVDALHASRAAGLIAGVASNAQEYTQREVARAGLWITAEGSPAQPEVAFWSFAEGFSKPSPGVFRFLEESLSAHRVSADQILMIGDRIDNDIEPAIAAGWQAWHFCPEEDRDWGCFIEWLGSSVAG